MNIALRFASAWPTPVYTRTVIIEETLRASLIQRVKSQLCAAPRGLEQVGGQRTAPDLLTNECYAISWLKDIIFEAVRNLYDSVGHTDSGLHMAEAWGVYTPEGAYHQPHTHHGSAWSGTLILDFSPSSQIMESEAGALLLHDPRLALSGRFSRQPLAYSFPAVPGRLVAFPSWLVHSVTPLRAGQTCTLIAFNAR